MSIIAYANVNLLRIFGDYSKLLMRELIKSKNLKLAFLCIVMSYLLCRIMNPLLRCLLGLIISLNHFKHWERSIKNQRK